MDNVVTRIRALNAPDATPAPNAVAAVLEIIIELEPEAVGLLPVLFPGNAVVAKAVAMLPTLLPYLQRIEAALSGQ